MPFTKKQKIEEFDGLLRNFDLLQRYFWDTRQGRESDFTAVVVITNEHLDTLSASVHGSERDDGGYIVIDQNPGSPSIQYLDEWLQKVQSLPFSGDYCLALKDLAAQVQHKLYVRRAA